MHCKKKDLQHTSALFALPRWTRKQSWHKLLAGMTHLHHISANHQSSCQFSMEGEPPWGYDIWYDSPPLPKALNLTDRGNIIQMGLPGLVAGQSARMLMNSGATQCFTSHAYAQLQRLLLRAETSMLHVVGALSVA